MEIGQLNVGKEGEEWWGMRNNGREKVTGGEKVAGVRMVLRGNCGEKGDAGRCRVTRMNGVGGIWDRGDRLVGLGVGDGNEGETNQKMVVEVKGNNKGRNGSVGSEESNWGHWSGDIVK